MLIYFDRKRRDFSGGLPLKNVINAEVIEVMNGRFDLEFEWKADFNLNNFDIILADTPKGEQLFYVENIEPGNGRQKVYCKHVYYLSQAILLLNYEKSGSLFRMTEDINDWLAKEGFKDTLPFLITGQSSKHIAIAERSMTLADFISSVLEQDESLVLLRDKWKIELLPIEDNRVGKNTGRLLAKRKNISEISGGKDSENVVTRLYLSKEVDPKTLVPSPISGPVRPAGDTFDNKHSGSLTVTCSDKYRNFLIKDDVMTFDIYDVNGNKVANGQQTGAVVADKPREERIGKLRDQRNKLQEDIDKLEAERKKLDQEQKSTKAVYDKIVAKRKERDDLDEKIATHPEIVYGKRVYDHMAEGTYTLVMTSAPKGYYGDYRPKEFKVVNGKTTNVDFYLSSDQRKTDTDKIYIETVVDSPLIDEYGHVRSSSLEVTDESIKTVADLKKWGESYFKETKIDLPEEYFDIKTSPEVVNWGLKIGDKLSCLYTDYNIDVVVRVTEYVYDPLTKKYKNVVMGRVKPTLSNRQGKNQASYIDKETRENRSLTDQMIGEEHRRWKVAFQAMYEENKRDIEVAEQISLAEANAMAAEIKADIDTSQEEIENRILPAINDLDEKQKTFETATLPGLNSSIDDAKKLADQAKKDAKTANDDVLLIKQDQEGMTAKLTELGDLSNKNKESIVSIINTNEGFSRKFQSIEGDLNGALASISSLDQTSESLSSKIASVENKAGKNATSISSLKQTATSLSSKLTSVEEITGINTSNISSLEQTASGLSTKITEVEEKTNGNTGKIAVLQQTSESLSSEITAIEEKTDINKTEISSLKQTADSLSSKIASVEKQSNSNFTSISTLEQTSTSLSSQIASLNSSLSKNSSSISSLEQKLSSISLSVQRAEDNSNRLSRLSITDKGIFATSSSDGLKRTLFEQTSQGFRLAGNLIDLSGVVRFSNSSSATYIDGGKIASSIIGTNELKANSISAGKIQSGVLQARHIDASYANIYNMTLGEAIADKITVNEALVDKLFANTAFIRELNSIDISASRISSGILKSHDEYWDSDAYHWRPVTEINLNTGEFNFMRGALYYYDDGDRGQLRTNSSFAIMRNGRPEMEMNRGGFQFYDYNYSGTDSAAAAIGRLTVDTNDTVLLQYMKGRKGIRIGREDTTFVFVSESVNQYDSSVNRGYVFAVYGQAWFTSTVLIKKDLYVQGDLYLSGRIR